MAKVLETALATSMATALAMALVMALAGLLLATWPAGAAGQRSTPQDVIRTASTVDKP